MNRWQASIPADKVSIFNLISLTNLSLKLQFCTKKAAMKLSSLPLKMSVSYRNRTYNRVLGGPRYIHLTKETNAVFPGFFDPLAPAAIIYNSNTFVMNYLFLISSDFSDFASPVTLERYPFSSKGFRHGSTLGGACYIHLTMRTSYAKRTYIE